MHEPEEFYVRSYCSRCDVTILFFSISYPGGRESEKARCPECDEELNTQVETVTTTVVGTSPGDVGENIFSILKV